MQCQTPLASLVTAQHRHHLAFHTQTSSPSTGREEDNTAVRYILPLQIYHQPRRKMNQCSADDEQASKFTSALTCQRQETECSKVFKKEAFRLGHFGQILTKPHKKCSEKCWLELYKQSWFIKMSSGHSSAFERKNLSSAASGGGSSSHSSLLASLRSRAASHSSRIHHFWHQY